MKKQTRNRLLFFSFIASVIILSGVLSLVEDAKYIKKPKRSAIAQEEFQKRLAGVSSANRKAKPKPNKTPQTELAYQLATIDNGYVTRNDPSIAVFNRLLTKLDSYFIENKQQIADSTVNAQELLKEEGIKVKLRLIMEGLQGVYPYKIENQKYLDILVYYMTFRKDFQSHSEAIISLKSIIKTIIG